MNKKQNTAKIQNTKKTLTDGLTGIIKTFKDNIEPHIAESIVSSIHKPCLVYLPDPLDSNNFIITLSKMFYKIKEQSGNIIILVEDSCMHERAIHFQRILGNHLSQSRDAFSKKQEKIYLMCYSDIINIQRHFNFQSKNTNEGYVSCIIFDDIKSIDNFLNIQKKLRDVFSLVDIMIGLTSSPFLFNDYYLSTSEIKFFECFAPQIFDKKTGNFYKRFFELSEIIHYESFYEMIDKKENNQQPNEMVNICATKRIKLTTPKSDAEEENKLKELILYFSQPELSQEAKDIFEYLITDDMFEVEFFISKTKGYVNESFIKQNNFNSQKILYLKRILNFIEDSVFIVVKDSDSKENISAILSGNYLNLDNQFVYLKKVKTTVLTFEELLNYNGNIENIIFFDYYPNIKCKKRYVLMPYNSGMFIKSLLTVEKAIELKIKPLQQNTNYLTEMFMKEEIVKKEKPAEHTKESSVIEFYISNKNLKEVKDKVLKTNLVQEVLIKQNKIAILPKNENKICFSKLGAYLSQILNEPVQVMNRKIYCGNFTLKSMSCAFGNLTEFDNFLNPITFIGNGLLYMNNKTITYFIATKQENLRIEIEMKDIQKYIFVDYRKEKVDFIFTLESYPKIYKFSESDKLNNKIKEVLRSNYQCKRAYLLDILAWKRVSIKEVGYISERYDFKITLDLTASENNRIFEYINKNKTSKSENESLNSIFNSGIDLDSILNNFLYSKKTKVIFSKILEIRNKGLSCQEIRNHFKNIEFNDYYFLECLLARKGRHIYGKLETSDFEKVTNLKEFCIYLDINIKDRFDDLKELIKKYYELKKRKFGFWASQDITRCVTITPLGIYFNYYREDKNNRVLREFEDDKFLRVNFREENGKKKIKKGEIRDMSFIYDYFREILNDGFFINDRKYFFLAMSASQLKLHSAWFVTPYIKEGVLIGADYIRSWLGDFSHIKNIGKYAVRLGQPLSSTFETVEVTNFREEEDLYSEAEKEEYCFSDGIGRISYSLAERVSEVLGLIYAPSAFQIRFAGYKGVVSIDPRLNPGSGEILLKRNENFENKEIDECNLVLRKSMRKFDSHHRILEVVSYSQSLPCHLNRQIIIILEALGIDTSIFIQIQDEHIARLLKSIIQDNSKFLKRYCNFLNFPAEFEDERFFKKLLIPIINRITAELSKKSKIFISKGRSLMGVLDEFGVLEENEVFINVKMEEEITGDATEDGILYKDYLIITSAVAVAKNPCLHPGDLRVVKAVNRKELYHMKDCIVFSRKGNRPIFNMCSGSDLDGDVYFCTWDKRLIPKKTVTADNYTSDSALYKDVVSMTDIINFYIKFMRENQLGLIANAHLALSDKLSNGVLEDESVKLAHLFNMGVDFPKTGFVARLPADLTPEAFPDFMEQKSQSSYLSRKVSGVMYRRAFILNLPKIDFCGCSGCMKKHKSSLFQVFKILLEASESSEEIIYPCGTDLYEEEAKKTFEQYKVEINGLMKMYGFSKEEEIFLGFMNEDDKVSEESRSSSIVDLKSLITKYRNIFFSSLGYADPGIKAWAWYKVSHEGCNEKILSFPFIVSDALSKSKEKVRITQELNMNADINEIPNVDAKFSVFVFSSRILLIQKNIHREDLQVYSIEKINSKEVILIYDCYERNEKLKLSIPKQFIEPFAEVFHVLLVLKFLNLKNIGHIFDFIELLVSLIPKHRDHSTPKSVVAEILLELSQLFYIKEGTTYISEELKNFIIYGEARIPEKNALLENRCNILYLTSLILSLNYTLSQKIIISKMLQQKVFKKTELSNTVKKETQAVQSLLHNGISFMGMFDVNDSVYLKAYDGEKAQVHNNKKTYQPCLLNYGKCSVESYKDDLRDFVLSHVWFKLQESNECVFEVKVIPGKLYFYSVPFKFINNTIEIRNLTPMLMFHRSKKIDMSKYTKDYINSYFINKHPFLKKETRENFILENNFSVGSKNEIYDLSFRFNDVRYSIYMKKEGLDLKMFRITKCRNIIGRYEIVNQNIDLEFMGNDTMFEISKEDITYERNGKINHVQLDEMFMLTEDVLKINGDGSFTVSEIFKGCTNLRLEISSIIGMRSDACSSDINICYKQIYLEKDALVLESERKNVSCYGFLYESSKKIGTHKNFESFFERIWKNYKMNFAP